MEWLGPVVAVVVWSVGVPLVVLAVLKVVRYDWNKPWSMWRTEARPLPLWVYVGVTALLGVWVLIAALTR